MKKHLSVVAVVVALAVSALAGASKFNPTNSSIPPICPIEICTPAN